MHLVLERENEEKKILSFQSYNCKEQGKSIKFSSLISFLLN